MDVIKKYWLGLEQRERLILGVGGVVVLSVIQTTAKKGSVDKAIKQMVPNNESEVRVVLEDVDFNKWLRWVDELSLTYGVNVLQVKADRVEKKPNLAEVRLTFTR